MTLDEFLAEARDELVRFEVMWREGNSKDAEVFPMDMEPGNDNFWWELLDMNIRREQERKP